MPSNLSPAVIPAPSADPRLEPGAYISDGEALYWVQRAPSAPAPLSPPSDALVVEDCRTNVVLELDLAVIESTCTLVRQAPKP